MAEFIRSSNMVWLTRWVQKRLKPSIPLFFLLLPALAYIIIFDYLPMYGVQIAFKDYSPIRGIIGSPWVGFKYFFKFFDSSQFWDLIKNTISINLYQLIAGFPLPILLALLLNYCVFPKFKRTVQMVTYAPHFISVMVLVGMVNIFLSPYNGVVNMVIKFFTESTVHFLAKPELFQSIFVWSGIWQNVGWGSIIYIGALASISPELHEAGVVDGASKLQRVWHIDIPGILPTIIMMLILNFGSLMNLGFQKIYLMQNDAVLGVAEVISTYVYKVGLGRSMYSYASAIGLFNNIINIILLLIANKIAKKYSETSIL